MRDYGKKPIKSINLIFWITIEREIDVFAIGLIFSQCFLVIPNNGNKLTGWNAQNDGRRIKVLVKCVDSKKSPTYNRGYFASQIFCLLCKVVKPAMLLGFHLGLA